MREENDYGAEPRERTLGLTPTWSVATVLTVFVVVSLIVERSIHRLSNVSTYIYIYSLHFWLSLHFCFYILQLECLPPDLLNRWTEINYGNFQILSLDKNYGNFKVWLTSIFLYILRSQLLKFFVTLNALLFFVLL